MALSFGSYDSPLSEEDSDTPTALPRMRSLRHAKSRRLGFVDYQLLRTKTISNDSALDPAFSKVQLTFASYPTSASMASDRSGTMKENKTWYLFVGSTLLSLVGMVISLTIVIQTAIESPIALGAVIVLPISATALVWSSVGVYVLRRQQISKAERGQERIKLKSRIKIQVPEGSD